MLVVGAGLFQWPVLGANKLFRWKSVEIKEAIFLHLNLVHSLVFLLLLNVTQIAIYPAKPESPMHQLNEFAFGMIIDSS